MSTRRNLAGLLQGALCPEGVAVLMYHAVVERPLPVPDWCFLDVEAFRQQLAYLADACQVIHLRDIPAWTGGDGRPAVALTFDDGFENNYSTVFPILQALGLPATVFLATGLLDSDQAPWFCHVHDAVSRSSRAALTVEGRTYPLGDRRSRQTSSAALQNWLKQFPAPEIERRTREVVAAASGDTDSGFECDSPYRMLRSWQVREMAASGLVDFGAHTVSHAILSRLSPSDRKKEINESVRAVAGLLDAPCRLFAYPNGTRDAFGQSDMWSLSAAGIRLAVTTLPGPATRRTPELALPRYGIGSGMSFTRFRLVVHHLHYVLSRSLRSAAG